MCITGLMFVFMSSFVLAGLSISEPLDVYNLGDRLYVSVDGIVGSGNGNLNINLVCDNITINLLKIPARAFSADEEQSYSIPYKILDKEDLEISNLTDITGGCQVVASLGMNVISTKTFSVSNGVRVSTSLDKTSYNPGEGIKVDIKATKENGGLLNGFIEGSGAASFSRAIENGVASEVFSLPETSEAGTYTLNVRAYDIGKGGILNEGYSVITFNINQVASSLLMSLSGAEVIPGNSLEIGVEVFDQSGIEMEGMASISVISPNNEEVKSSVQLGEFNDIEFFTNSTVGTWKIIGSFNNLIEEREFEMLPVQKVDFSIEDSVLTITNVGNVLYNKTISLWIGDELKELDLNIKVGESRKFNLKAPNGKYDVKVDDGDSSISHEVMLTGNAIKVSDLRTVGIFKGYSVVWIFLVVVLGGIGIVFYFRRRKKRHLGGNSEDSKISKVESIIKSVSGKVSERVPEKVKSNMDDTLNFTRKSPSVQGLDVKNYSSEDKSMVDFTKKGAGIAESVLVLKGEKHLSAVIALSIRNNEELSDVAKKALNEIVEKSRGRGLVDSRGDYIFVIYTPVITRTYGNTILAVRAGMDILNGLKEYNKKFRDKVNFGISVHIGELIASKSKNNLKYVGIGNTISFAKRMSDSDVNKLIISDEVRKKTLRDLKVANGKEIGGSLTYVVNELKDHSGDAARLDDLMKRMKK